MSFDNHFNGEAVANSATQVVNGITPGEHTFQLEVHTSGVSVSFTYNNLAL